MKKFLFDIPATLLGAAFGITAIFVDGTSGVVFLFCGVILGAYFTRKDIENYAEDLI